MLEFVAGMVVGSVAALAVCAFVIRLVMRRMFAQLHGWRL